MSLRIGAIGVQKVSAKLLEQGFLVSTPIIDEGYDLITDWKGKMMRVQVKSTMGAADTKTRNKLKFFAVRGPGYGYGAFLKVNKQKVRYKYNACDAFIFYHIGLDALFTIPQNKLPKTKSIYLATNSSWRDNWDVLRNIKKG
jgi:hypothetical protein